LLEPDELEPPLTAFDAALAMSEAVSFTVLTTLLITLRAPESAPPFLEELRFFEAFFAGAFFAAFFAGAFFEAFFEAFFADAFFEEEAFFDDAFFEAFLLAPFLEDDFFEGAAFFADFFAADFFDDDFLAGAFFADFFADFFLAAMDSSPIQNRFGGEPYVRKKKIVLRGNRVARISM